MSMTCRLPALGVGLLGLALSLAPGAALEGQELGSFAGTILDDLSGQPLSRAVVSLPRLQVEAVTNENGQFLLEGLPRGSHEVKFEAHGYVAVVEQLEITEADFLQIRLDPLAAVLDQILVIAGRSPGAQSTDALQTPEAIAFKTKYLAKYTDEKSTDGASAYYYQAAYFIAAAASAAKSIDPAALKTAMKTLDLPGPCGQWKNDAENNLHHDIAIVDHATKALKGNYTKLLGAPEIIASEAAAAAAAATTVPPTTKAP